MALRIKEICKHKGITLGQIARELGISNVNLSNSLNGNPTLARLQEVADVLDTDVADLFERSARPRISGHVEIDGIIYKVTCADDLKQALHLAEQEK